MITGSLTSISNIVGIFLLYAITGLGPGVVFGVILGNLLASRHEERLMDRTQHQLREAAEHNAQWDPSHERWHNKP
jgi:hypothetical protein